MYEKIMRGLQASCPYFYHNLKSIFISGPVYLHTYANKDFYIFIATDMIKNKTGSWILVDQKQGFYRYDIDIFGFSSTHEIFQNSWIQAWKRWTQECTM